MVVVVVGGGGMGVPPQPANFFETPTPIKTDAPHGALPLQLKMKPPI